MKLHPDYEVARANNLNRDRMPGMDYILGELLHEETHTVTQATLEGKRDVEWVFLAHRPRSRTSTSQKDFSRAQCHGCKEYGHISSHCKNRNLWVYCKQIGHIVSEWPTRHQKMDYHKAPHRAYQASIDGHNLEGHSFAPPPIPESSHSSMHDNPSSQVTMRCGS